MDWPPGSHSNTFGGNLIVCASAIATINYLRKNRCDENAIKIGNYLKKRFNDLKEEHVLIGDVRGIGLMIGLELVKNQNTKEPAIEERNQILRKAAKKGLLLLRAGKSSFRIVPPLTITRDEAERGIEIFEKALKEVI